MGYYEEKRTLESGDITGLNILYTI